MYQFDICIKGYIVVVNTKLLLNTQDMTKERDIKIIDRKLSVVIALLYKIAIEGDKLSLKDQVRELDSFGLESGEIAQVLNKKIGHIRKELSTIKK